MPEDPLEKITLLRLAEEKRAAESGCPVYGQEHFSNPLKKAKRGGGVKGKGKQREQDADGDDGEGFGVEMDALGDPLDDDEAEQAELDRMEEAEREAAEIDAEIARAAAAEEERVGAGRKRKR